MAKKLSHSVFFTLKHASDETRKALVDSCHKRLAKHEGVVFFAAGTRGTEFDRPVNDDEFDVALHVVFESGEAHDVYQTAPQHLAFIEENKANWKTVRVFDAWV